MPARRPSQPVRLPSAGPLRTRLPRTHSPRTRLLPVLLPTVLVLAGGCTTVRPTSSDASPAPAARVLTAAELRTAAVGQAELGPGYTVSLVKEGQAAPPPGAVERQLSDVPACQPVLDAIGPGDPAATPQAEADLMVNKGAGGSSYVALLGYPAGRSTALQSTLDQVLAQCAAFGSTVKGRPGRSRHQLAKADTPTPEGADAVSAFTLTSGDQGGPALTQRAAVVRVGTALAVFSTVGTAKEPAAVPDPAVVQAQTRKLRAAER